MYQYGNVAFKYQNERRYKRPNTIQSQKNSKTDNHSQSELRPSILTLSRGKLLVLFAMIIVIAVLILLMARSVIITEINYDYLALEKELQQLQESNALLEAEIVELRSPDRILSLAEKELGMTMRENSVTIMSRSNVKQP